MSSQKGFATISVGKKRLPSKPTQRSKTSSFGITINPNIPALPGTELSELVKADLLKSARDIFGSENNFKHYVKFIKGGQWDSDHVVEVPTNNITIEINSKNEWHIQGFVTVVHRSFIHLNRDKMLLTVAENLQNAKPRIKPSNIHIDIQTGGKFQGGTKFDDARRANYPKKDL